MNQKNANFTFHSDTKSYKNLTFTGFASTLNEFNKYLIVVVVNLCVFITLHFIKRNILKQLKIKENLINL